MMDYTLRPFQAEDVEFFTAQPRSLILYEPRLGKTVVTSTVLGKSGASNIIICCPLNALNVWEDHLYTWYKHHRSPSSMEIRKVRGQAVDRMEAWKNPRTAECTIYLTTYGSLMRDYTYVLQNKLVFDAAIFDEYHRYLKNRKNRSANAVRQLTRDIKRVHQLSGTAVDKSGPPELFAPLQICNPKYFTSYWKFVNTFCYTTKNHWGGLEIHGLRNPDEFHRVLQRYARVRKRKEVAPQIPKVTRSLLPIDLTGEQLRLYEELDLKSVVWTNPEALTVAASSMEKILRLRQLLACPRILDSSLGVGGAIEHMTSTLVEAETEEERHIVIFTPFRPALGYIQEHLAENGITDVFQLHGGLEPDDLKQRIQSFRETKGVMLCTIKYAQAFSLEPATAAYFIGFEWSPNDNRQAEDRLLPQQGVNPINSFYYSYRDTVDVLVADTLVIKHEIAEYSLRSS